MDSSKSSKYSSSRNSTDSNPSDHQRRNLQEANENDEPNPKRPLEKHSKTGIVSLGNKKKILAERNDGFSPDCDENIFRRTPEASAVHLCSDSRSPAPYDPVINYTSPRPLFLRYNPNRGREILQRIEGELKNEKVSPELLPVSSEECVEDDEEEEEEEVLEEKPRFIGMLWKSFLVIGVLLMSTCCISWMNSGYLQEEIFLDISNMDVFREGVDIKRVEDEILKVGIGEAINSGLLISEVKELHDFNEMAEEELASIEVIGKKAVNSGLCISEVKEVHDFIEMAAGKENEISSEKEEEIVSIEVMEKKDVNSGLLISEVKVVHDFNEMAAGKENEISREKEEEILSIGVMEKKDANSGLLISEVKEVHDFNEMVAEQEEQETLPLVENEISSEKEDIVSIEVMEKKDGLSEFGQDSHDQLVSLMPLADGNPEERQLPAIFSNTEMVLNDANLLLLLLTTSSAVLVGFLVYLCRRLKSGSAAVPIEIEAKITDPNATLQIEMDNVSAVKLEHNNHKGFHGSQPPIVELIGEFSLDKLDSKEGEDLQMVQCQRKKVMKKPLTSANKIYQSPSMKSSAAAESTTTPIVELLGEFSLDKLDSKVGEDLQMAQYQRKRVMKKTSTSASKIYQSPSMKSSAAAESTTTPEKPLKKEDEEINKGVSTTPLRRSNRIRNQNASPLNS